METDDGCVKNNFLEKTLELMQVTKQNLSYFLRIYIDFNFYLYKGVSYWLKMLKPKKFGITSFVFYF